MSHAGELSEDTDSSDGTPVFNLRGVRYPRENDNGEVNGMPC